MQDTAKLKKKYIWMIIIGFAAPVVLLIISMLGFGIVNFLLSSSTGESSTGLLQNIINTVLLIIGILAVTGFVWGPVIGIVGIVKLSGLNKMTPDGTQAPADTQPTGDSKPNEVNNQGGQ